MVGFVVGCAVGCAVTGSAFAARPAGGGERKLTEADLQLVLKGNADAISAYLDVLPVVEGLPKACFVVKEHPVTKPTFLLLTERTNREITTGAGDTWKGVLEELERLEQTHVAAYTGAERAKFERAIVSVQLVVKTYLVGLEDLESAVTEMGRGDCYVQGLIREAADHIDNEKFHREIDALIRLDRS